MVSPDASGLQSLFGTALGEDSNAYIILRSKDNVDLRVSKHFLSSSSGLFRDMFRLPQPTVQSEDEEYKDGLAVIQMPDADVRVLQNLLLFCVPSPKQANLEEIEGLAHMYDMPGVETRILKEKIRDRMCLIPPVMLSTIRQKTGQDTDAYIAAAYVILFPDDWEKVVDLGLLTMPLVQALKTYHSDCISAAKNIASPEYNHYQWIPDRWARTNWFTGDHSACCKRGGNIYIGSTSGRLMTRYWWREYMYASRDVLEERPCGAVVRERELFDRAMKEGLTCSRCSQGLGTLLWEFTSLFAAQIDEAVSSVLLKYE